MILGAQHGRVATTNHAAATKQRGRKYHYDIGSTTWKGCNNKPCSSNEAKTEKVPRAQHDARNRDIDLDYPAWHILYIEQNGRRCELK